MYSYEEVRNCQKRKTRKKRKEEATAAVVEKKVKVKIKLYRVPRTKRTYNYISLFCSSFYVKIHNMVNFSDEGKLIQKKHFRRIILVFHD